MSKDGLSIIDFCKATGGDVMVKTVLKQFTGIDEQGNKYSPYELTYGSNKVLYWKCDAGHLRLLRVSHKLRCPYAKCPICEANRLSTLSLKDWCNEHTFGAKLKSEWTGITKEGKHLDFNSVLHTDDTIVQWKCSRGHSWYRSIVSRVSEQHNCAVCSEMKRAARYEFSLENALNDKNIQDKFLGLSFVDNVSPRDIWYRTRLNSSWLCKNGHTYKMSVYDKVIEGIGCPTCKQLAIMSDNSLINWCNNNGRKGQLVKLEWTGKSVSGITRDISKTYTFDTDILTWNCLNNHEFKASVKDVIYKHTSCQICSKKKLSTQFNNLMSILNQNFTSVNGHAILKVDNDTNERLFIDFFVKQYNTAINYIPAYWGEYNESKIREELKKHNIRLLTIIEDTSINEGLKVQNDVLTCRNLDMNTLEKITDIIRQTGGNSDG